MKEAGGHILRGGAFEAQNPIPYSFQGLEEEGLQRFLAAAWDEFGLPVVTEV